MTIITAIYALSTITVFVGCPYGVDDEWGITWPNTPGGDISTQPCPGGVDDVGMLHQMKA